MEIYFDFAGNKYSLVQGFINKDPPLLAFNLLLLDTYTVMAVTTLIRIAYFIRIFCSIREWHRLIC